MKRGLGGIVLIGLIALIVIVVVVVFRPTGEEIGEVIPPQIPEITVLSAPTTAEAGQEISFSWRIEGLETTIPHTAIHFDYSSNPGAYDVEVTPGASGYGSLTPDFASGEFSIPDEFSATVTPDQTGTLYYRAHAIIDGKNYWTNERSIAVSEVMQLPSVEEFTIDADDNSFDMDGQDLSSITVSSGSLVKITFLVDPVQVYFGGLDFRGCGQNTGKVAPGGSVTVEFTATSSCDIKSYWPASNRLKDTLQVVVQ